MLRVSLSKRLDLLVLLYLSRKASRLAEDVSGSAVYVLRDPFSVSLLSFRFHRFPVPFAPSPFRSVGCRRLFVPCTQFLPYDCAAPTCGSLAIILLVVSVPCRRCLRRGSPCSSLPDDLQQGWVFAATLMQPKFRIPAANFDDRSVPFARAKKLLRVRSPEALAFLARRSCELIAGD